MATVKWIKVVTDIFDDEKMLLIEGLPGADSIMVIWFKLLCLAGKTNNSGVFIFNDRIPYTDEMLAAIFRRDINLVRLALKTFEDFGMIEIVDNVITIPNWSKHQTLDAYEKKKERDRLRVREKRAQQKALISGMSPDASQNVARQVADTSLEVAPLEEEREEDIEKERDIEGDIKPDDGRPGAVPYEAIKSMYNEICVSFPRCVSLSDARKKAIKARITGGYTPEDFKALFTKAEASSFLKGKNDRNWSATFDWLIKDTNMAKVLDGNYDDRGGASRGRTEPTLHWMAKYIQHRDEPPKTVEDDPELRERADRLRQSLTR